VAVRLSGSFCKYLFLTPVFSQTNGTHQWLTVGREEPAARVSAGGKRPTGSRSRKRQRPRRLGIAQARPPVAAASQLWGSRRLTVPGDGPGRWREQPRQKWGSPEACRVHKIFPRSGTLIVQAEELAGDGLQKAATGVRKYLPPGGGHNLSWFPLFPGEVTSHLR